MLVCFYIYINYFYLIWGFGFGLLGEFKIIIKNNKNIDIIYNRKLYIFLIFCCKIDYIPNLEYFTFYNLYVIIWYILFMFYQAFILNEKISIVCCNY